MVSSPYLKWLWSLPGSHASNSWRRPLAEPKWRSNLSEHPESFLSAVQVWITLLGLLTGYFGGESLAGRIQGPIASVELFAPYAHAIAYALSFGGILYVSVVLGELLPKRLGTLHPEKVAVGVALPMHFLATVARPAVVLLTGSTRFLMRLFGLGNIAEDKVTDEEIRHLVAESHEQGNLDADERNMLNRVLRLGDRTAESLMTPRTLITWLDADAPIDENQAILREHPFSPLSGLPEDDSDVLGVLESKTLVGRDCDSNDELLQHPEKRIVRVRIDQCPAAARNLPGGTADRGPGRR